MMGAMGCVCDGGGKRKEEEEGGNIDLRICFLEELFQIMKVDPFTKRVQSLRREDGVKHHFRGKHNKNH